MRLDLRFQIPDYLRSQISDLRFQKQNMSLLLFLQSPTPSPTVVNVPERMPALLTIIYLAGLLLIVLLLLVSLFLNRGRGGSVAAAIPEDLPKEVKRRLGSTSTNRGLRALRWIF